jgi:hypothetical protein
MKNLILITAVIAFVAFSVSGCSKGTAGPAGPAGAAGPDSIIYSAWIGLDMTVQNTDSLGDTTYYEAITANSLTSAFLDNGVVISYIGVPGGAANGDTLVINSTDVYTYTGGGYLTQDLIPGEIELYSNFNLDGILYRYVLVPGDILATNVFKQYTAAQLKAVDFTTLSQLLNTAKAKAATN